MNMTRIKIKWKLFPSQIIVIGFLMVILLGSFFLMLPICARNHQITSFPDALFTATSAVCVTGLVVQDTATYWSTFGQTVILMLIQIGGMGIVTIGAALHALSGRKFSLKQRSTMQESICAPQVNGIVSLSNFIVITTVAFELIGAAVMAPVFCGEFGVYKGIWYSVFHSISAFCNAGFDLMGVKETYSSLTYFAFQPVINFTIMMLIIIGGIGFLTWDDIRNYKLHIHKYRMQSKIVLITTLLLIIFPSIYFMFFEFSQIPASKRLWIACFQSVTPRTAGFNTIDLNSLTGAGRAIMIVLMLIGGSPASTAGGMKTTTFAVMLCTAISVFRHSQYTNFFGRRISNDVIRNASTIFMMYLTLFLTGGIIISKMEALPLSDCLFETASAIGTTGLSLGITSDLGIISEYILILLMYFGRVGGLTLIFSVLSDKQKPAVRLPEERLTVG